MALRSDPYARLDWSAGLLTDEGFYIHNARNTALFGHPRTDAFNNRLLSPLLDLAQVAVFRAIGVGSIQARSISVLCSLGTLALLFGALRRPFGRRIAGTAVLFLGLDHTNLLFNRMALMDTPAALGATAALFAFVRSIYSRRSAHAWAWLAACGALIAATVTNRMLCAYLVPAPFVALWGVGGSRAASADGETRAGAEVPRRHASRALEAMPRKETLFAGYGYSALAAGLAAVLVVYAVAWYMPHHAEIARMSAYYRVRQIQPGSAVLLGLNVEHALFGDYRGLSPYLFRHTPVLFVLALLGIGALALKKHTGTESSEGAGDDAKVERYLAVWLLLGWALLAVISYSPSRYYVSTYPAMAAVAAITLWRLPDVCATLLAPTCAARCARAMLAAFVAFHATLAVVHYGGVLPRAASLALLYAAAAVAGLLAWTVRRRDAAAALGKRGPAAFLAAIRTAGVAAVGVWAVVNSAWLGDWLLHLEWTQYQTSRMLASTLPAGSVLIGDLAPGLCLDNVFQAVHVQAHLCNDVRPVEEYAGSPRYILILDGRWKEGYWKTRYPSLIAPPRRIWLGRVMCWEVGLYPVR